MQLNLHFLFNTLNMISATMYENVQTADKMLANLSDFLRLTLRKTQAEEHPLEKELDLIQLYLEIMRARFGDKLSVNLKEDWKFRCKFLFTKLTGSDFMKDLKVLIVDDEQPARQKLISFCKDVSINSIIEATNGLEAVQLILEQKPDLVFLDIQMPGMKGFEVIEAIQIENMPIVIFVKAYDRYALNAFEVRAVDYLLKPFDQERFQKAFDRALQLIQLKQRQAVNFDKLLQLVNQEKKYMQRILLNFQSRFFFIPTKEIRYISAVEKYIMIHTEKAEFLVREAISHLEGRLDPEKFARIHRSYMINLDFIKEIQPWSHGDCLVILKNGTKFPLSRKFRENLLKMD